MKHSDFKIGCKFRYYSGIAIYICTDIGTRVIVGADYKEHKDKADPLYEWVLSEKEMKDYVPVPDDYDNDIWTPHR